MLNIVIALEDTIMQENWYAALFISLALPDICGKIETPNEKSPIRYIRWFNTYLPQYEGLLSGEDCYALRCALLHQGKDNISSQRTRQVLDHYVFLEDGVHCRLFQNCTFNDKQESFLVLNVKNFCSDICLGARSWLNNMQNKIEIIERMNNVLEIHGSGYAYKGLLKLS